MNISSRRALIECNSKLVHVASAYNGLVAPVLGALWLQSDWGENGLRPAEIMELVCSPRAALLAGVNSVNSRSFSSQTLTLLGQSSKSTRGGSSKMDDGCIMD